VAALVAVLWLRIQQEGVVEEACLLGWVLLLVLAMILEISPLAFLFLSDHHSQLSAQAFEHH
jgi:hypothetical protein